MRWRLLIYPVFILGCYLFSLYLDKYNREHNDNYGCGLFKKVYNEKIRFKINNKFVDKKNHNNPVFIYIDNNNIPGEMAFSDGMMDLYDSAEIGDSVIKSQNTIWYIIKSAKTGKVTRARPYGCKDTLKFADNH